MATKSISTLPPSKLLGGVGDATLVTNAAKSYLDGDGGLSETNAV